ncbi:MAG: N-acetylglutaminylglutamine synthetase [Alphaproteobacteria bacterium]|nr:MAG: N-acetylglutaminylglutamine synthetase [Alphaproteobacteria bacterium]
MSSQKDQQTGTANRPPRHRLTKLRARSLKPSAGAALAAREGKSAPPARDVSVECGWGRLFFAQTFADLDDLVGELLKEKPNQRDIAFYLHEPHVALSKAPQRLFLDPSHTYRLDLTTYRPSRKQFRGFFIRRLCSETDAEAVNRIYAARHMVPVDVDFFWKNRDNRVLTYFVAEDENSGEIVGTVTGVDHIRAFNDPERGSSLWCLAVDPQAANPGIGEALVRRLAEHFQARGCMFMDLSVMHDNDQAIALYEKLGFERVPFFALKNKSAINEKLFAGPSFETKLNPYALIIVNEARRRGIAVEVLDAAAGYFRLTFGGRSIVCRESLSELTTAIAMSRCADKAVTRRLLGAEGLMVPAQVTASNPEGNADFLKQYERIVVKPAEGEQGRGISVDIRSEKALEHAIAEARRFHPTVLLEQFVEGEDLRIIVINHKVVAGAVRRPPQIVGDGRMTVGRLIEKQSRRREAATQGESTIPLDEETERCVAEAGYGMDDVLPENEILVVRRAANLHTGGTIHDVTDDLHPTLVDAAVRASKALDIPVVGLDFIVEAANRPDYVIIEANERPGLANHEPQPTAERFIDLLFPHSIPNDTGGS